MHDESNQAAQSAASPLGDYAVTGTTAGVDLIRAERLRQIEVEGFGSDRDAAYKRDDLITAAIEYANVNPKVGAGEPVPFGWPWSADWWKPSDDPIRNLVKAGALLAAEIDRRLAIRAAGGSDIRE